MEFCRLCAVQKKPPLIPILSSNLNVNEKILRLLQIKVNPKSSLPQSICLECLAQLNQFYSFYTSSNENQVILGIIFSDKTPEEIAEESRLEVERVPLTKFVVIQSNSESYENQDEDWQTTEGEDEKSDGLLEMKVEGKSNKTSRREKVLKKKKYDRFDCYLCEESLETNLLLTDHFKLKHNKSKIKYKCFVCSKIVDRYRSYTRHIQTHQEKRFTCDQCQKSFSQKITLVQHLHSHSNLKNYECPDCDVKFKQKSSLFKHHRQKHTNVLYCMECSKDESGKGKAFTSELTLKQHMKSKHKYQKDIICQTCSKTFASQSALYYHKNSAHPENKLPHSCDDCSNIFKSKVMLNRHMAQAHNNSSKKVKN